MAGENRTKLEMIVLHALDVLDLARAHTYRDTRLHGRILDIPSLGLEGLKDHHLGVAVDNARAHTVVIGDLVLIVTGPAQTVAQDGGVEVVGVRDGVEPGHQRVVDGALSFLDGDANRETRAPLPYTHVIVFRVENIAVRAPRLEVHDVAVPAEVGHAVVVAVLGGHVAAAVEQDGLAAGDFGWIQDDIVFEPLAEDNGCALAVEGAHLDGAHTTVVGEQMDPHQSHHPAPHSGLALDQFHQQRAGQHAHKTDDGFLAGFLGVEFGEIAVLGEMGAERGL